MLCNKRVSMGIRVLGDFALRGSPVVLKGGAYINVGDKYTVTKKIAFVDQEGKDGAARYQTVEDIEFTHVVWAERGAPAPLAHYSMTVTVFEPIGGNPRHIMYEVLKNALEQERHKCEAVLEEEEKPEQQNGSVGQPHSTDATGL
jgi:hypothetical protein